MRASISARMATTASSTPSARSSWDGPPTTRSAASISAGPMTASAASSSRPGRLPSRWAPLATRRAILAPLIGEVRGADDGDAWIVGGGRLQQAMIAAGALDRLELFIVPEIVGGGHPDLPGQRLRAQRHARRRGGAPRRHGLARLSLRPPHAASLALVVLDLGGGDRGRAVELVAELEGRGRHEDGAPSRSEAIEPRWRSTKVSSAARSGSRDPAADGEARRLEIDRQAVFDLHALLEHVELQRADDAD